MRSPTAPVSPQALAQVGGIPHLLLIAAGLDSPAAASGAAPAPGGASPEPYAA